MVFLEGGTQSPPLRQPFKLHYRTSCACHASCHTLSLSHADFSCAQYLRENDRHVRKHRACPWNCIQDRIVSIGVSDFSMSRRTAKGLLAIVVVLFVSVLATQAVGHWHYNPIDEAHCQVCHIGHSAIPQPAVQAKMQSPVPVARFAPAEQPGYTFRAVRTLSSPRAPPV